MKQLTQARRKVPNKKSLFRPILDKHLGVLLIGFVLILIAPSPILCEEGGGKSPSDFLKAGLSGDKLPLCELVIPSDGIPRTATPEDKQQTFPRLVIYAGTLIDGTGGKALSNKVIVCEKGRITNILDPRQYQPAPETYLINASSEVVLPGLIDAEVCLMGDGSGAPAATKEAWETRYRENASTLLYSGVTTVRDVYGGISNVELPEYGFSIKNLRLNQAVEDSPHPRILATGPPIGAKSSTYFPLIRIATPEDAEVAVAKTRKEGADLIYFFPTDITPEDNPPNLSQETIKALVTSAHEARLKITAESIGLEANRAAVMAGVDSLKHGVYLDDSLILSMREKGTYYHPTLAIFHNYLEASENSRQYPTFEVVLRTAENNFRKALAGGVRIVAGSDSGGKGCSHGIMLQKELAFLVGAGMTPGEAIHSATGRAAECLGIAKEVGTISPNKIADLIVTDGNPLLDLSVLQKPSLVIQNGKIVFRKQ